MNVSDIIAQSTTNTGRGKSIFSSGSFLNIGKRGQVVQGVVSKVADKVSISFNGTEAAVPLSSVQNATEGETRSFKDRKSTRLNSSHTLASRMPSSA